MWYNIASFNGNKEAVSARDSIIGRMTGGALEKAQDQAMECLQSKYRLCQLGVQASTKDEILASNFDSDLNENDLQRLKNLFFHQTLVERKQTQYALKFFGLYEDEIDGLWGKNTIKGLKLFQSVQKLMPKTPENVIAKLVRQVELPTDFFQDTKIKKPKLASTQSQQNQDLVLQRQAYDVQLEIYRQAMEAQLEAARMRAQQQAADRLYDFGMRLAFPNY